MLFRWIFLDDDNVHLHYTCIFPFLLSMKQISPWKSMKINSIGCKHPLKRSQWMFVSYLRGVGREGEQQQRWEEGKWAMRRKPEGEWWSVRRYPATFPDPPVGPLCYLDKMGGIKWPAVPLGWVADPLAREESQPLLPSSLQWERLFWFLSSLSHRQTWEAQFIWDRVRGNRAPCHLNTRTLSRQRFADSLCQCLPWL